MASLRLRAQRGEPQAIATLLQGAFPVQPIELAAQRQDYDLVLQCRSSAVLAQDAILPFLKAWFCQLQPAGIHQVQVQAHPPGQRSWQATLSLSQAQADAAADSPVAPAPESPPTAEALAALYQQFGLAPGAYPDALDRAYFKQKGALRMTGTPDQIAALTAAYQTLKTHLPPPYSGMVGSPPPPDPPPTPLPPAAPPPPVPPSSASLPDAPSTAHLGQVLAQNGLAAKLRLHDGHLQIGLPADQHPTPRQPVAKIYTLLQSLAQADALLNRVETVSVYGLIAPRQVAWKRQFTLPTAADRKADTDLFSFQNRYSSAVIFPLLSLVAIVLNLVPVTRWLLNGVNIWFHEFGHAIVAWLSGRRAIPLPVGWTNVDLDRSLFVYGAVLGLLGLLFWMGKREHKRWPMGLAVVLAVVQFGMTWGNSAGTFLVWLSFGGIGGEFCLCALLMVSFFFALPNYFRWDFYRYPVVVGAAFTFWHNVWFWRQIDRGREAIPWGTLWGGANDSGGDMNQLIQAGWSTRQIIDTYNLLGSLCVLAIVGTYLYFSLRQNRHAIFGLLQRWQAR